ncbi:MAG: von Willebrand factor type A domain-containing protein, partial [Candidatus Ornithomonoglobus sp.]
MNIKIKVTAMALAVSILALTNTLASEETEYIKYTNEMEFVTANGIMEGDENGDLRLDDTITRAEFVKMLMTAAEDSKMDKMLNGYDYTGYTFDDVPREHWALEFIAKAKALGFVDGVDNKHFSPEQSVTYAQAIKIVLTACGMNPYNVVYPYGYISAAIDSGMLTGINVKPDEPITRGDAAKLMYNANAAVNEGTLSFELSDILMYNDNNASKGIAGYGLFSHEVTVTPSYGGSSALPAGSVSDSSSASAPMQSAGGGGAASVSESAVNSYGMAVIPQGRYFGGEEYENYEPNEFRKTKLSPLSTFSIDTDTASYSNMRRFISLGKKPQDGSIRTEELINYFEYETPEMAEDAPFGVTAQLTDCPWSQNKLARVTIAGAEAQTDKPSNLVFLIDVSGSMSSY